MLQALVAKKILEPVAKRLPERPEIVRALDRVGRYGGTLRTALRGNSDHNAILRLVGNQGLARWRMDFNGVVPNVAEKWSINSNASEFTFTLRKGMRWSDGSLFTADDVLFSMNDVVAARQYYAQPPSQYVINEKFVEVSKIDDYTVRFKFAAPYLSFLEQLATPLGQHPTLYQKKYCSHFHPKYNPNLQELLVKERVQDWGTLMRIKCGDIEIPTRWSNTERPTLDPWLIKEPYSGGATRVVLERNPYFWQVDKDGKQLPYIDRLQMQVISEVETIVLAAVNGQLDFQHRHVLPVQNRPVLSQNADKAGIKLMRFPSLSANSVGIWFNHTTKNEKVRKLIRNKDFRIALSLATDRQEINEIVYLGQATPWQIGPLKSSKWYNEKLAAQYLKYDLKEANQLLDKLGLTKRDAGAYRLFPEGGRVTLNAIIPAQLVQQTETLELMRKQWARAGIDLLIQVSERSLFYDRANANDYEISVDTVAGGMDAALNPRAYVAIHPLDSRMSLQWVKWFQSNGKQGEEPTASMKKRMELYQQWLAAHTPAEADALFKQLLELAAEEFEIFGIVRPPDDTAIRSNRLINVFEQMPSSWTYTTPAPSLPQQWFFLAR